MNSKTSSNNCIEFTRDLVDNPEFEAYEKFFFAEIDESLRSWDDVRQFSVELVVKPTLM